MGNKISIHLISAKDYSEYENSDIDLIKAKIKAKKDFCFSYNSNILYIFDPLYLEHNSKEKLDDINSISEKIRIVANTILNFITGEKIEQININNCKWEENKLIYAFIEGLLLSNYSFTKYKTKDKQNSISVKIADKIKKRIDYKRLKAEIEEINFVKDLVNEPFSTLNTEEFAKRMLERANKLGIKSKSWTQEEIKEAKFGGLLGVNKGSVDEPRFIELEWKPKKYKNSKPIVLIGKGVVFDAGGMNVKTGIYMSDMKSDMAGGATIFGCISTAAKLQIPLHIIALIPITDNRLNGNALVPGDIIEMSDGTTVEIDNTDAEGRLILADAIAYANKLKPELLITMATLTGSASRALGSKGIAAMQENLLQVDLSLLTNSGEEKHERLCFFPMWKEYEEELKSKIADLKNCGSGCAGMITAAKFLSAFSKHPLLHLDIAGVAFLNSAESYRNSGATAYGLRLLVNYLIEKSLYADFSLINEGSQTL